MRLRLPDPRPERCRLRRKVDSASCPSPVCLRLRHRRAEEPSDPGKGLTQVQLQPPLTDQRLPAGCGVVDQGAVRRERAPREGFAGRLFLSLSQQQEGNGLRDYGVSPRRAWEGETSSCSRAGVELMGLAAEQAGCSQAPVIELHQVDVKSG